jgi:hypothetical protein
MPKRKVLFVMGYCKLCPEKELKLYGITGVGIRRHQRACREAGCWHPPVYRFPQTGENTEEGDVASPE